MSRTPSTPHLTDPEDAEQHLHNVLDVRHVGTPTALVVCGDSAGVPIAHLHVLDCDAEASPTECAAVLDEMLARTAAGEGSPVAGLLMGLTRPGGDHVQAYDRAWLRALYRVCHRHGLTAYGVFTVTRTGVREVHIDDAA